MSETTIREPRADKVAIVTEIAGKLDAAEAVFVVEYRGLTVGDMATVRNALRPGGAEMVIYKNTLAKLAARQVGIEAIDDHLTGPTALVFVADDVASAAKALRDSAKALAPLTIKGGVLGDVALTDADIKALADLPSRDELLARFAGALQAPLSKTASLLAALPRNFAYGLSALIEKQAA
ncbi:MAG: 50S ribosomal protein L10 [Ilumatobacter coccineus]|uniref:Large ribosomal subunit protein uL10 n=1 Tax=Ilumatobacter coccineus TaxID=467094 RepID=A0A2G6KHP6_9ACTN|nr:MAG: 50S ribosomal protein L10 [Ilumatobacter coccineus]